MQFVKYAEKYNPIMLYWHQIETGQVRVGKKIRKTFQKLAYDVEHESEYYYSPKRANHIIEFAENFCRQSKGKFGGQLVKLELWEKAILAAIFGFIDIEGNRKYREAILIIGKKNGKSLLASIVGLYMLLADGEAGPEVYCAATKKDQAKIVWSEAKKMVKKSPHLADKVRALIAELDTDFNDGTFKPLASDSDTLDGLNIHCAIMDEIHQWKNGKSLYDILADGITAREQPLIFIASTAGFIREDLYDERYDYAEKVINGYFDPEGYQDEHFIAFIYELDSKAEWINEEDWYKANPGLGTIKNLKTLRDKVRKATANPAMVKNLLCKEFNMRETAGEAWLSFDELDNTETFNLMQLEPKYGIGGVDLSSTTDLTAAKMIFKVLGDSHIYVNQMYWIPEDLVEKKVNQDHIPYDIWIDRGYVRTCPGNKIDYHMITDWFKEQQDVHGIYMFKCGYDSWSAQYWVDEMKGEFGPVTMEPVQQGVKTLSNPMKILGADLSSKLIVYNNNPVDKWCLANTSVKKDINDNIQPIKGTKSYRRIDGTASLLDAYVVYLNHQEEYETLI